MKHFFSSNFHKWLILNVHLTLRLISKFLIPEFDVIFLWQWQQLQFALYAFTATQIYLRCSFTYDRSEWACPVENKYLNSSKSSSFQNNHPFIFPGFGNFAMVVHSTTLKRTSFEKIQTGHSFDTNVRKLWFVLI